MSGDTDRRPFDVAYEPDGSHALVVYSDNTTSLGYRTYNGSGWSAASSMASLGAKPQWVQVVPGRTGSEMFIAAADLNLDLYVCRWDGSTMSSFTTITTTLGGSNTTEQFWLLPPKNGARIIKWREVPNPDS